MIKRILYACIAYSTFVLLDLPLAFQLYMYVAFGIYYLINFNHSFINKVTNVKFQS